MLGASKTTPKIIRLTWLVFVIGMMASCAQHHDRQPSIIHMPYDEARKVILQSGWKPVPAPRSSADAKDRIPRFYYDAGYTEVTACSGTGMGYCAFKFQNEKGEYLKVTTRGGDYKPDDTHPPVVIYAAPSENF